MKDRSKVGVVRKKEALILDDYSAIHEIVKDERKRKEQAKKKPPRRAE
jgi:hypothetical protein